MSEPHPHEPIVQTVRPGERESGHPLISNVEPGRADKRAPWLAAAGLVSAAIVASALIVAQPRPVSPVRETSQVLPATVAASTARAAAAAPAAVSAPAGWTVERAGGRTWVTRPDLVFPLDISRTWIARDSIERERNGYVRVWKRDSFTSDDSPAEIISQDEVDCSPGQRLYRQRSLQAVEYADHAMERVLSAGKFRTRWGDRNSHQTDLMFWDFVFGHEDPAICELASGRP